MKGSTSGVGVHTLLAELGVLGLVADEGSGDDHFFATDEDDLLAGEEFFGDDGTEAAVEVVAAVDEDGLFENHDWIVDGTVDGKGSCETNKLKWITHDVSIGSRNPPQFQLMAWHGVP